MTGPLIPESAVLAARRDRVRELSAKAGQVVIAGADGRPRTCDIGDVPNFEVFWTLARNLREQH